MLHLADLDPVPTDLDLVVDSADVHVVPVRLKPNVVPGGAHALAGPLGERVREERGRRAAGMAEIASGKTGAGQVHLAGVADRDGVQLLVEDIGSHVADRARIRASADALLVTRR